MRKLVYVAGPYMGKTHSAQSYNEIEENIRVAEKAAIRLWDAGFGVFCPHLNTRHFEVKSEAPREAYIEADLKLLEPCDIILMLPSWETSRGALEERLAAINSGKIGYENIEELIRCESPPK